MIAGELAGEEGGVVCISSDDWDTVSHERVFDEWDTVSHGDDERVFDEWYTVSHGDDERILRGTVDVAAISVILDNKLLRWEEESESEVERQRGEDRARDTEIQNER